MAYINKFRDEKQVKENSEKLGIIRYNTEANKMECFIDILCDFYQILILLTDWAENPTDKTALNYYKSKAVFTYARPFSGVFYIRF